MPHQQGHLPNSGPNTIEPNAANLKEMHIIREDMTSLKNSVTDLQREIHRGNPSSTCRICVTSKRINMTNLNHNEHYKLLLLQTLPCDGC